MKKNQICKPNCIPGGGYPSLSSSSRSNSRNERRLCTFSKRIVFLGLLILFVLIPAFASEKAEGNSLSLRLNAAPYSVAVFDFYNGKDIEGAKTVTATGYGFSAGLEGDWEISNRFRLYPEAGYALTLKKETVIPEANAVQYIKLGAGADYIFSLNEKIELYGGLFGGAMFHINNSKYNVAPYFGLRLGGDYALSENITLGAFTRVAFSFLTTGESGNIRDSLTVLVDPLCAVLTYTF